MWNPRNLAILEEFRNFFCYFLFLKYVKPLLSWPTHSNPARRIRFKKGGVVYSSPDAGLPRATILLYLVSPSLFSMRKIALIVNVGLSLKEHQRSWKGPHSIVVTSLGKIILEKGRSMATYMPALGKETGVGNRWFENFQGLWKAGKSSNGRNKGWER